jgi:cytidylate kinase
VSAVSEGEHPVPGVEALTRVVALDGPAGSGKSSVARAVARALGWRFVDTGATYRAVTLHVLRAGVDLADTAAVASAARTARVELDVDPEGRGVRLGGEDESAEIRGPVVTGAVSAVSAVPAVRGQLIELQRRLMGTDGAVVEGRDIATVVAPRAAVKVYLDARPEVRARRRAGDLAQQAVPAAGAAGRPEEPGDDLEQVERSLAQRDALDSRTNRFEPTEGAVHLDTSDLSLDQVVMAVVALVEQAGLEAGASAGGSATGQQP